MSSFDDYSGKYQSVRMRRDIGRAIVEPEFAQNMAKLGAPIDYRDGPAFVDFLNKDAERINAAIKRIGKVD